MYFFRSTITNLIKSNKIDNCDFADRLNSRYTVAILILFCILVGSAQWYSPIACWTPAEFTLAMVKFTDYTCWLSNTYYVPSNENLPNANERRNTNIAYYQWVPYILCFQAVLFYIPSIIWTILAKRSNLSPINILKMLYSSANYDSQYQADRAIKGIIKLIDRGLYYHKEYNDNSLLRKIGRKINRLFLPSNQSGLYLTSLYIFVKSLYMTNVCGQFFLLNAFMGSSYNLYGIQIISELFNSTIVSQSTRFPRETICDFVVRTLGNQKNSISIQCSLPINLFNEKIFIFIWFWLVFVAFMTAYNLIGLLLLSTKLSRSTFISRFLRINDKSHLINTFINDDNHNTETRQNDQYYHHENQHPSTSQHLHRQNRLQQENEMSQNNENQLSHQIHHNRHHQHQYLERISTDRVSTTLRLTKKIDPKLLNSFIFDYLKYDGVMLLRIIKKNTNDIVVSEIIYSLWNNFTK